MKTPNEQKSTLPKQTKCIEESFEVLKIITLQLKFGQTINQTYNSEDRGIETKPKKENKSKEGKLMTRCSVR